MDTTRAPESSSASHDNAPPCMSNTSPLGSSRPDLAAADPLANRPDPPNPPDLSDRRGSRPGPTSPKQQFLDGDGSLATSSEYSQRVHIPKHEDDDDDASTFVDDKDATPPRLDKGKGPETAYLSAPEQRPTSCSGEEALHDDLKTENLTGSATEDDRSGTPVSPIIPATNEEDSESSCRGTQSESQDSSYPPSLFESDAATTASTLAGEVVSWKQKEKQKADPEAETGSLSEASPEDQPFRPLNVGDPGWEKSAGRPPQKLPVRFRDAVGRNFLFPWEKAKTWAGMRRLINSCFLHVDVLGPHVMAARYDLSVNLPLSMDVANDIMSPGSPITPVATQTSAPAIETPSSFPAAGSSSAAGASGNANSSQHQQQQQHRSSFVVLPELWEDTIEPGMLVVQHMWPFQTPNYVAQPSPPQSNHHFHTGLTGPTGVHPPGRGRGARGRGRGGGTGGGIFGGRGGVGGNIFAPPPPPGGPRPPIIITSLPPRRGKTRKRQDRA
ncbi:hypothetical protein F5Y03DRAFT_327075 [Xylaria venustula]|nr:hypothetical protein F5Y03DRAFT_327075 [Xylaria venustula]